MPTSYDIADRLIEHGDVVKSKEAFVKKMADPKFAEAVRQQLSAYGDDVPDSATFHNRYKTVGFDIRSSPMPEAKEPSTIDLLKQAASNVINRNVEASKQIGGYVKEHPAETALGIASIPLAPETILGALLLGGAYAGARAVDKTHPFTQEQSDFSKERPAESAVDIVASGVLGGVGGGVSAMFKGIGTKAGKAVADANRYNREMFDYDAQLIQHAKDLKAQRDLNSKLNSFHERASSKMAANHVSADTKELGNEALKYHWGDVRDRVRKYIEHNDPRYAYGEPRYGMKVSDDEVARFIENADKSIPLPKPPEPAKGWDLTKALPNTVRPLASVSDKLTNNLLVPKLIAPVADFAHTSRVAPVTATGLKALLNLGIDRKNNR